MEYKVVVVGSMAEVQKECNRMADKDWKLVTAYPETFQECCNQQSRKTVLIFGREVGG